MKRKFWNWVRDSDTGERTLVLNGTIAEESWFGDEVTPGIFRDELMKGDGNITVRIDGIAASAATMIAMAGTTVEMSPVGMMMVHNPSTAVIGNTREMQAAIQMLDEVKENIINAYELKTSLPRQQLSDLMDAESWMNAKKAVELGFADRILFANEDEEKKSDGVEAMLFSRRAVTNSLIDKIKAQSQHFAKAASADTRVSADALMSRLNLIVH